MRLAIRYVNGQLLEAAPSGWPMARGDGIDYVDLRADNGQAYRVQGRSVVWLRREDGLWVLGGGTVAEAEEVTALPDGTFETRRCEYMPDLSIEKIKLGHWEPGTAP